MPDSQAPDRKQPIFADMDIPCPRCEYNLRGLVEPRCPECGLVFSPQEVLCRLRMSNSRLSIWWLVRNIYLHPMRFWMLPEAQTRWGPPVNQVSFLPTAASALTIVILQSAVLGMDGALGVIGSAAWGALVVVSGQIHRYAVGRLTRQVLQEKAASYAWVMVYYPMLWLIPICTCLIAALPIVANMHDWPVTHPKGPMYLSLRPWHAWPFIIAVFFSLCWAICLYRGVYAHTQNRPIALWCTLANPFWYILGLAVFIMGLR